MKNYKNIPPQKLIEKQSGKKEKVFLALADGKIFEGYAFGDIRQLDNPVVGEVVFNTSMYGYQEILTDPSYAGQIMTFTTSNIGNVGCNPLDEESAKVHVEAVVVKNLSRVVSNYRATESLEDYLKRHKVMGIGGIDTRELVQHLRDQGSQMGAIAVCSEAEVGKLVAVAKSAGSMEGKDYVQHVSCKESYAWNELPWSPSTNSYPKVEQNKLWSRPHVVAIDCGIKYNILRLLVQVGFRVTVVPATSSAAEVLEHKPDALFLSNGPGDPATLDYVVSTVKDLLGKIPSFGICLGHQIIAQALGAKTYKLKFGHRGGNHPVMDLATEKVEVTVQNHGFAVDTKSIPEGISVSHVNLNDQTVEGLSVPEYKTFCVQYHPEANPGPRDAEYLFKRFYDSVVYANA